MTPTSIETMTGKFVDLVNPDPATIDIKDIAWALSRMPRYVGHTISAVPYTIGQHSIYVVKLVNSLFSNSGGLGVRRSLMDYVESRCSVDVMASVMHVLAQPSAPPGLLLELLMHDASEAYIVDVPTPLKMADGFRDVYLNLEKQMMAAIRQALQLPDHADPAYEVIVKWADAFALTVEAHHLIRSRGSSWTRLLSLDMMELRLFDQPRQSIEIYEEYLDWYNELSRP